MKPTVLLDVDGVLADFVAAALNYVEAITGKVIDPKTITTWEVFDSLPDLKWCKEGVWDHITAPGGCSSIPIIPGAQLGVEALQRVANVVIVTSPMPTGRTWVYERERWLANHFNIYRKNIIHASDKSRVHGDLFIDDKLEHLQAWQKYWIDQEHYDCVPLLWSTPRTATANTTDGITVVSKWDEVLACVECMKK